MNKAKQIFADVDARLFRAAHYCVGADDIRYYLQGVRIERHPVKKGVVMVATDGHRLMIVHDEAGRCGKPIIVKLDTRGLAACINKGDEPRRLVVEDSGIATIAGHWISGASCLIDGTFPEWWRCVPVRKWPNRPASFNREYLASFHRIGAALEPSHGYRAIRILTGETESDPALVLFPATRHAFGVLMPMRAEIEGGLPLWIKPVLDARKVKKRQPAKNKKKKAGRRHR